MKNDLLFLKRIVTLKRVIFLCIWFVLYCLISILPRWYAYLEDSSNSATSINIEPYFSGFFLMFPIFFMIGIILSLKIRLKVRYHDDNEIVLYLGILHNRLYINEDLVDECGIFDTTCYGQLPTGEEVVARQSRLSGSAKIYVGNSNNNRSHNFF